MNILPSPIVSVVITTLKRPKLVPIAIKSALSQTLKDIEVIVVVDGPDDPLTVAVLEKFKDPRFRFIVLPVNLKLAGARNEGVKAAKTPWVAFCDDDDEWLPQKLEKQLALANQSEYDSPIVSSRLVAETEKDRFIWPRRLPRVGEAVGDYLFIRNSLFQGEGIILPSTLFVQRQLLLKEPFVSGKYHEDYDWLLRVCSLDEVAIEFVPEPMVIWHFHQGQGLQRDSQNKNWKQSLAWIKSVQSLVSPRAYSAFIVLNVSSRVAEVRDWSAFRLLLKEFVISGQASPFEYVFFMAMWFIPESLRHRVRGIIKRQKSTTNFISNK